MAAAQPEVRSMHFSLQRLKHKKHWNSFTTDFFVPSSQVLATLEREGRVVMPAAKYKALEEQGLECPLCHAKFPTIPSMKKHYKLCYDKVRQ